MPRRTTKTTRRDWLLPGLAVDADLPQASVLDLVDNVLNKGVVLDGDLVLGVAKVDLIYARLSVLLAALDRLVHHDVLPAAASAQPRRRGKSARKTRRVGRVRSRDPRVGQVRS